MESSTPSPAGSPADRSGVAGGRRRGVGVAAAILLLAGGVIGALLVRSDGAAVEPATLQKGWTRAAGPGFTLGLPPGWRSFPTTTDANAFAALEKADPARAAVLRAAFGGEVSPFIKFIAFDLETPVSETFETNMNVIVLPATGGLEKFVDTDVKQLRGAEGVASTVQTQRITLPVGESAIVTAQLRLAGNPHLSVVTHYVLEIDEVGFILQFTTLADHLEELSPVFEDVARSFRFA